MKTEKLMRLVEILLSQDDFITISALANLLNCSERTIHNYMNSPEFKQLLKNVEFLRVPNKGIQIKADSKYKNQILSQIHQENTYDFKYQDDYDQILFLLLTTNEVITIQDLSRKLYRSTNAIYSLIKNLNEIISKSHCSIKNHKTLGLQITGNEKDIRTLFYKSLMKTAKATSLFAIPRLTQHTISSLTSFFNQKDILNLVEILDMSEKMLGLCFCDEDYNMMLLYLGIIIIRIRMHKPIQLDSLEMNDIAQEYYCATLIKCYVEKEFHMTIDENEINYISLLLASTRKKINPDYENMEIDILDKFLNLLGVRLNFDFNNDYELKHNLMLHLKPAIKRMRHGIPNENPLLEQIRLEYTEVYISVITAIEDLENMEHIYFDSNELGYICLHIIAAINRPNNIRKIKAVLICTEGLSFEIFIKNLLESYFKEINIVAIYRNQIQQNDEQLKQYDLIIDTTGSCELSNAVHISSSFSSTDHDTIRHYLNNLNKLTKLKLEHSFNYLSFFIDDLSSQEELLKKYCSLLYEGGYVTKNFYQSVVNRTKIASTYVARGIAVPHGAKDEVIQSIITAISLKHPIQWDDEKSDFVILVALNDKNIDDSNVLFRKIMKIAASNTQSNELKKCQSLDELIQLINN